MKTTIKPRARQVRCYECGSPDVSALCHHCWRPGCRDHIGPASRWAERLAGREGTGRDLEDKTAYHCRECHRAAVGHQFLLGAAGLVVMTVGLIALGLSLAVGLALVLAGLLLAGWVYVHMRRRTAGRRASQPLLLHPKIDEVRLTERLGVNIVLGPEGGYKASLRPVEGEISTKLVFRHPDRERLDRYATKRVSGRDAGFCAGCLVVGGPFDIGSGFELSGPVLPLNGTIGAFPVFRAEGTHSSSSPFRMVLPYRLEREPRIRQGPVWVTPSLVAESDRRALELDIQWVDLGPRDKRLRLEVIELIQLKYPVAWGNVEMTDAQAIQTTVAEDSGGPEPLRSLEWRQLLPTPEQRQARQLKLTIRFEEPIDSHDTVNGRLEAVMRGALSGLDGVRLYDSLGRPRGDWRGATVRTRVEADFKLSLGSIRYQDVRIVPEREAKDDDSNIDVFGVIPDDETVIELTSALSENRYVKRVIEHPPRSGGRADHVQRYWDIAGRHYEGVYPLDFQMVVTGEEIHRGDIRPVGGTTTVRIVVHGAYTDEHMKGRVHHEWEELRKVTKATLEALAARRREPTGSDWPEQPADSAGPRPGHRLSERLGKLDDALLDGRISQEQYEEMRARAEQQLGDW
jgi:hypothetical protein